VNERCERCHKDEIERLRARNGPGRVRLTVIALFEELGQRRDSVLHRRRSAPIAAGLLLTLVALSPFAMLLRARLPLSGAVGLYAEDQLQYFAWIRDASVHVFAGNRFDLAPGPRTFLHPGFTMSGLVHRLTPLSVPLSFWLWEPIAIATLVIAFHRYARRFLAARDAAIALFLALFAISPLYLIGRVTGPGWREALGMAADVAREMWMAGYLWGSPVTAVGIALMPICLLALETWRTDASRRVPWLACTCALLVCWIHPWQGATLGIAIAAAECAEYARTRRPPRAAWLLVASAFAIPALYFAVLPRVDPTWRIYESQNLRADRPWLAPMLALLPLMLPALPAYQLRRWLTLDWQSLVVRAWLPAAVVVYLLPLAYPFHAIDGLSLPLGLLAVQGVRAIHLRLPTTVWALAAVMVVGPGAFDALRTLRSKSRTGEHGYFVTPDEARAFAALQSDRRPGGVLTTVSTGALVPFLTGREVYVGHDSWSPDFPTRARRAEALFAGELHGDSARAFVNETRARFLVGDCRHRTDVGSLIAPMLAAVRRYGCATIYELKATPANTSAAGPPDS